MYLYMYINMYCKCIMCVWIDAMHTPQQVHRTKPKITCIHVYTSLMPQTPIHGDPGKGVW